METIGIQWIPIFSQQIARDIVQKMKAAYDKFAQDVGVVIPRGAAFAEAVSKFAPINADKQSTVTINLGNMLVPGHNATQTTPKGVHPGI